MVMTHIVSQIDKMLFETLSILMEIPLIHKVFKSEADSRLSKSILLQKETKSPFSGVNSYSFILLNQIDSIVWINELN